MFSKSNLKRLMATLVILTIVPCEILYGQVAHSQLWLSAGYDSPSGFILEFAAQYSFFIAEGRLTGKEVVPDDVGGTYVGLLVGVATPADLHLPIHMSINAGISWAWFIGD